MRFVIATILLIVLSNSCEGNRGLHMKKYYKNINKAIYNACNKKAYNNTNYIEIYKCINVNSSNNCKHLDNFTKYEEIRIECINKYNSELASGILISIVMWIILGLCFMK